MDDPALYSKRIERMVEAIPETMLAMIERDMEEMRETRHTFLFCGIPFDLLTSRETRAALFVLMKRSGAFP